MKKVGLVVIILLVVAFAYGGYDYIVYREQNAVSNAGFVKSDSLSVINFKVAGKIDRLTKKEGESFKKGELLASLDEKDFLVAKDKAQKTLESLTNNIEALKLKRSRIKTDLAISKRVANTDIKSYSQKIKALELSIKASQDKLYLLNKDVKRFKNLVKQKLISKNKYEQVLTSRNSLKNAILSQKKELLATKTNLNNVKEKLNLAINKESMLKELSKEIEALGYKKDALKDSIKEIENKISYCKIYAPFDGVIAKRFVNDKRVVAKGYPIYAVVDPKDIHAEVLLSEKKLYGVKKGNEVTIEADAIKDKEFKGTVESILPTSASTFSLVPRDIASGEFTKLDQRFVVRIKLKEKKGLKVGMSLNIAIKRD
ncbi:MAG: HlyD family efflux transporter periplasmic adaptor subunit [Epsilonproteobacteria bacterium]|nr:HlyD family efflux transporter periplasmic adaptor subunit [Campylobacterota bacterium]